MYISLKTLLDTALFCGLGGILGWLGFAGAEALRDRLFPVKPAKWNITVTDPDGIPVRQQELSAKGVARLITDLNNHFYR